MATHQDKTRFPLKLLVDEKRNRVLLAEASKDFVDILFGFLTLPMGTIMRITRNQKIADSGVIGGIYDLYQSVEDLGSDNFSTTVSKSSLLNSRNPCEKICKNFKLKIDDSSPVEYYNCTYCGLMSNYCNSFCCYGYRVDSDPDSWLGTVNECQGGFLKRGTMLIVSDDLQVTLNSPSSLVQHLSNLGITDMTQLTEMSVEAGVEEISSLLKCSLISKSALTDVFLVTQGKSKNPIMPEPRNLAPSSCEAHNGTSTCHLSLKLVLRKSTNRLLCAEASDDFVNLLFSFLTIPLGSVVKLLHGQSGFECIDNLHKSVEKLESQWLCTTKRILLNPGFANRHKSRSQPPREKLCLWEVMETGERISGRFVKKPSLFLALDNLVVRDLSSTSCIGFLKEVNVPICDIEELMVTVDEAEALGILKASLTSSSALTNGLNFPLKKHKQEE